MSISARWDLCGDAAVIDDEDDRIHSDSNSEVILQ